MSSSYLLSKENNCFGMLICIVVASAVYLLFISMHKQTLHLTSDNS